MDSAHTGPVGVFGGTFNPIHYGHLRSALELVDSLQWERLHLMPCAVPPHRGLPACSAEHRAAMVELAVAGEPRLSCDRRELEREGPSYTIDSLAQLRAEIGPERGLCLVMGGDAVLNIRSWHRWEALLDYCHIVVIARPGWELPASGAEYEWLQAHRLAAAEELACAPAGGIWLQNLRPLSISSTEIRELLTAGRSARYLLPEPVLDYIERYKLYL